MCLEHILFMANVPMKQGICQLVYHNRSFDKSMHFVLNSDFCFYDLIYTYNFYFYLHFTRFSLIRQLAINIYGYNQ